MKIVDMKVRMIMTVNLRMNEPQHPRIGAGGVTAKTRRQSTSTEVGLDIIDILLVIIVITVLHPWRSEYCWRTDGGHGGVLAGHQPTWARTQAGLAVF